MTESKTSRRFERILVGYDGSPESEKAFQLGQSIANTLDSRLEILAVIQPGEPETNRGINDVFEHAREKYTSALRKLVESANSQAGKVETSVVVGHPADEIVKRAAQSHSDLIVVGVRGTSRFKDLEMGSVSEYVLSHASCPVLVTK